MKTGCEIRDEGLPSLRWVLAWLVIAFTSQSAILNGQATAPARAQPRPNILFIMVDDLRPELGCYGQPLVRSPHIDALAASAIQFNRAYCMVPTCGASRASLMTGLRPHPTRFVKHGARINREAPRALSLHTCLQQAGYTTVSLGKVIHHPDDQQGGWSIPPWRPEKGVSMDDDDLTVGGGRGAPNPNWAGPAFAAVDDDDGALVDVEIAARAIGHLQQLSASDKPFFLAVGFIRPHLPFLAPRTSWELYDALKFAIPSHIPSPGIPRQALHNFAELRNYQGIPKTGPLGEDLSRQLIHGYCASVSFVDVQVGRVLDELERLKLADNTIVVLWG
ncbi:MAG TPA: sulfatase-like hydrolase/transferase, partial [Pirellulaceae bacterium]|nr:sulfatase-like hydrolase/transferase [Pirellulaceae bacterium]